MAQQYATVADFSALGLPANAWQNIPPPVGPIDPDAALLAASEDIDSYLRSQYTLPLRSWGTDIKKACCQLAAWTVIRVRGFNPNAAGDVVIRQNYEDAVSWLTKVAQKLATPNVVDAGGASAGARATVNSNTTRGWTRRGPGGAGGGGFPTGNPGGF